MNTERPTEVDSMTKLYMAHWQGIGTGDDQGRKRNAPHVASRLTSREDDEKFLEGLKAAEKKTHDPLARELVERYQGALNRDEPFAIGKPNARYEDQGVIYFAFIKRLREAPTFVNFVHDMDDLAGFSPHIPHKDFKAIRAYIPKAAPGKSMVSLGQKRVREVVMNFISAMRADYLHDCREEYRRRLSDEARLAVGGDNQAE